ncbi:hypothetical protein TNCV_2760851 [Trichonephila clavipes]|nr:hypothetical protein TNCV_2760851 [Trichonephila clavipes]
MNIVSGEAIMRIAALPGASSVVLGPWVAFWLEQRTPDQKAWSHSKIVDVEIGGVAIYRPFGEFRQANSYCHLYGAQGLGQ